MRYSLGANLFQPSGTGAAGMTHVQTRMRTELKSATPTPATPFAPRALMKRNNGSTNALAVAPTSSLSASDATSTALLAPSGGTSANGSNQPSATPTIDAGTGGIVQNAQDAADAAASKFGVSTYVVYGVGAFLLWKLLK